MVSKKAHPLSKHKYNIKRIIHYIYMHSFQLKIKDELEFS